MNLYRPKLPDDRGNMQPMATPAEVLEQDINIFKLPIPPCKDKAEYRITSRWFFSPGMLVLFLYWPVNNFISHYLSARLGISDWVVLVMAAIFCIPLYWFAYVFFSRATTKQYRGILKHNLICPSCLFGLTYIPTEPDGCTVCPECGSAWRLPETNPNELSP